MKRDATGSVKRGGIPRLDPCVFALEDAPGAIRHHFETHGYVVIRALDQAACVAHMKRQVTDLWLKQPWMERLRVYDSRATGEELDIERDTERYLEELTRPGLDAATLARYRAAAPFHAGFGAACDPQVFHWPEVWAVRQDPRLYDVACALLSGETALWVDINRSIQKLPDEGDEEFLHNDVPILHMEWRPDDSLGGKVIFNADGASFVCVPHTNTREAHAAIRDAYGPLYPNARATDAKWALDPRKPDPLDLVGRRRAVHVPQGCVVFWSKYLMHGVEKNPRTSGLKVGMYLGYFKAGSRPEYRRKTQGAIGEREDRIASYRDGRAPMLWPSLDRIHYFPKRYLNFPKLLAPYLAKTRPEWPGVATRAIQSGPRKGEVVGHMVPVCDADYTPPPLTPLGERLLGLAAWSHE